jgi:molecular chaperone GrpE
MEDTVKEEVKTKKKPSSKEHIEELEQEVKSLSDQLLRAHAEFDNTKKRLESQRISDRKYASKYLIDQLLTPLSQLEKIVEMKTEDVQLKNFLIGFKMVKDALFKVLESDGLKQIDALDQPFDPNLHEAIETLEDKTKPSGINVEVVNQGYTYKEQLLRPAVVKINEWREENGENK